MFYLQIAFFGAGYTLRGIKHYELIFLPFAMAIVATTALLHISHVDRAVRNIIAKRLADEFEIHIRLREDNLDDRVEYEKVASSSLRWIGSAFYINMMFYVAIIIDLFAGWLLTTAQISN